MGTKHTLLAGMLLAAALCLFAPAVGAREASIPRILSYSSMETVLSCNCIVPRFLFSAA